MTRFIKSVNFYSHVYLFQRGALMSQLGECRTQGRVFDPHPGCGVVSLSKTLHPH